MNNGRFRIGTAFLFVLLMIGGCEQGFNLNSTRGSSKYIEWCKHKYFTGDDINLPFCSIYPLNKAQIKFANEQFRYAAAVYRKYIGRFGLAAPEGEAFISPNFYFITMKMINDKGVFVRDDFKGRIAGRFIPRKGWIFVTERSFTKAGYTDIAHESVHWLNVNNKIYDPTLDERIADKMEKFYVKELPYRKYGYKAYAKRSKKEGKR